MSKKTKMRTRDLLSFMLGGAMLLGFSYGIIASVYALPLTMVSQYTAAGFGAAVGKIYSTFV